MKSLSVDMTLPKFGEYNYYYGTGPKPELILCWVRDTVDVLCKETQLLIDFDDIDIYDINRIDMVVGGDHRQGVFRFLMKIVYIMNNGKIHESTQPVGYILCKKDNCYILYKKDNGIMLKNIIYKDLETLLIYYTNQ